MELSDETKRDLMEFQNLQQQLQFVVLQRQQYQLQLAEIERVAAELGKAQADARLFRSIGPVLVPKAKADLEKEMQEEKELLGNRSSLLGKQEEKMKQRLLALQEKFRKLEQGFPLGEGGSVKGKSRGAS